MKFLYKKALAVVSSVIMILCLTTVLASAASAPKVAVDGAEITIPASYGTPYIDSANRTQIPIRAVSEALGVGVAWDQATQTATIDGNIKIKLGGASITTPYGNISMDTKAVMAKDRIYVPFRFLCNALGYDVDYTTLGGNVTVNIITKVELTIAVATSVKSAMNDVIALYKQEKSGVNVTPNYSASGTLRTQIENGSPIDLFVSADAKNMNTLKDKGLLINDTITNTLGNDLVLIVPKNSALNISSFADVAKDEVKTIGIGTLGAVPAGDYGKEALTYYKVWDAVSSAQKLIYGKDVGEVRTFVETGNVDCGIVYRTDALLSGEKVKIVATAIDASHTPIVYPAAVIKTSTHQAATKDFLNFLSTPAAKAVFEKYGFKTL